MEILIITKRNLAHGVAHNTVCVGRLPLVSSRITWSAAKSTTNMTMMITTTDADAGLNKGVGSDGDGKVLNNVTKRE